ncbi:endonuclease III [Candidatus Dependentiae bacterium Noda2021]|nr:endonuclease III [Candidatus Dependentiae bacterium Noda2021]
MNNLDIKHFQSIIWDYYQKNGRLFDWRHTDNPYHVVVSEIMLQQTQTARVAIKFPQFITTFPTFHALANASLHEVLLQWQGMGYNRRGMYLHQIAKKIVAEHDGVLPNDPAILETFPGIGKATAASICAFAYNNPTVFIETNIRAVFIYFFFANSSEKIHDKQIEPLVARSLEKEHARDWYYALMDYGVYLKKNTINPSRKSKHHAVQSKFEGSNRQVRGLILKKLLQSTEPVNTQALMQGINRDQALLQQIIDELCTEKLIKKTSDGFIIT